MAKGKKTAAPVVKLKDHQGMSFQISPERDKELREKLQKATDYYANAFSVDLSVVDIHKIMRDSIEADKRRVFLKQLGSISETDVLWFAQEFNVNGEAQEPQDESGSGEGGDEAAA